jgi:hypothetical protein
MQNLGLGYCLQYSWLLMMLVVVVVVVVVRCCLSGTFCPRNAEAYKQ